MNEHAQELNALLVWILLGGGAMFIALAKWIASQLMKKLEGIEHAINETNRTLGKIEGDLRGELSDLERRHENRIVGVERRVDSIDQRCSFHHGK